MAALNIPLLDRLRDAAGDYVPLDGLGLDTERVRADLDALAAFGFGIERHPYRGAAYAGPAGRLCPDQIEHKLATRWIGRRIAVWSRVASTNDLAARAGTSASNVGLVVLAEEQTAGRGRRGRSWTAPPRSSILMSVLLFPPAPLAETAWLTALGAVATAEVVAAWTGLDAGITIKWPNDVRVGGRKIAGVLVERGQGAVIGIGLNANVEPGAFPPDLRATATSLGIVTSRWIDRSELARALLRRLDAWYELGRSCGPESLNGAWRDRSEHLGQRVAVATPQGLVLGRLDDLHLQHGLSLTLPDGRRRQIPIPAVLTMAPHDAESCD
jgi:BirA family transcriptional regulator, biotin operon repressor / biotin---[acetyl-CoA-carboxylase] ligase